MQSKQLITTSLNLIPDEVIQLILIEAFQNIKEIMTMSLVSHSFLRVLLKTLLAISHNSGYCSREQEVSSTLLNLLKTACQKLNHLRAQIPRPPIILMAGQSGESLVCHSLTITDVDFDFYLEKPLPCDTSQVHTLLISLTDKQYEDERFHRFGRVVKFFQIHKFPNLRALVLNNVNCNNELLECFQEYNLEYFHLRYSSLDDYIDPKIEWQQVYHLDKLVTLPVKELRIDMSTRRESRDVFLKLSPKTRNLILNIDAMGSILKSDFQPLFIEINAKKSKPSIVKLSCNPSSSARVSLLPPKEPSIKEFICLASPEQLSVYSSGNTVWGQGTETLCIHKDLLRDISTTFPNCRSPTYYDPNADVVL